VPERSAQLYQEGTMGLITVHLCQPRIYV